MSVKFCFVQRTLTKPGLFFIVAVIFGFGGAALSGTGLRRQSRAFPQDGAPHGRPSLHKAETPKAILQSKGASGLNML